MNRQDLIITIYINADTDTSDVKNLSHLACDRIEEADPSVEVQDVSVDEWPLTRIDPVTPIPPPPTGCIYE